MEPNQDNNQPNQGRVMNDVPQPQEPTDSVAAIPRALDLLRAGWEFAKTRRDLYTWYVVSLAVVAGLGSEALAETGGIFDLVALIALLVTFIFVALNSWSVIYAVSQPNIPELTYKQTFGWSSSNFFPLLWTSILSGIAVIVGVMLLVIPGIIISIYFYFVLYAQAHGARGGKEALKRSYNDVKGRWWTVTKKLIGIGLYVLLAYIFVGMVYEVLLGITGESTVGIVLADILTQGIAGGVIGVVVMHAVGHYYKYLRANPLAQPETEPVTE